MNKNLLTAFFLFFSFEVFAQNVNELNTISEYTAKQSPVKKASIKLYPNPSYGKISISSTSSTPLHFYIFDLEGTLIYQTVLRNKERKNIDTLKKGTYLYDVFEKDESIEEGKIIIK